MAERYVRWSDVDGRLAAPAAGAWPGAALGVTYGARALAWLAAVAVLTLLVPACVERLRWGPSSERPDRGRAAVRSLCRVAGIAAVSATLAAANGWLTVAARTHGPLRSLAGSAAVVQIVVRLDGDPQPHSGRAVSARRRAQLVVVPATVVELHRGLGSIRLHSRVTLLAADNAAAWLELLPSSEVEVSGRLSRPRAGEVVAAVVLVRGPPRQLRGPTTLQRAAGGLRSGLRTAAASVTGDAAGLLPGLVIGDTSRLDPGLAADFRTAGLTHLVAVSGANIALVFAAVLAVARRLGVPRRVVHLLAGIVLAGFVVVARPQPSVLRAAAMAAVVLVATLAGRQRAAVPSLLVAVFGLCLFDPVLATSAGFVLSVAATAAILLIAPRWQTAFARRLPPSFAGPLAGPLAVALAAQLACGPIIAALAGQVSIVAVGANLLAEPAVGPATILGATAMLLAPVSMPIAEVVAHLAAIPTGWLAWVARHAAHLPGAAIGWRSGWWGAATLGVLTVIGVALIRGRRSRSLTILAVACISAATTTLSIVIPAWPPSGWLLIACDVGQGDGLLLNVGSVGAVVVDTGPDPQKLAACLEHAHVAHVSLVVLSHLHADHVEGLPAVLARAPGVPVATGALDEPPEEFQRVLGWLRGQQLTRLTAGEVLTVGQARLDVLAPRVLLHGTDSDPNNDSLVIRADLRGVRLLLTGDVERVSQQALLADGHADGQAVEADVLKIPHHGSANQAPEFLAAVHAAVAVASVGLGNDYGHPAQSTLADLRDDGARTFRTDLDGTVAVSLRGGALVVSSTKGGGGDSATAVLPARVTSPDRNSALRRGWRGVADTDVASPAARTCAVVGTAAPSAPESVPQSLVTARARDPPQGILGGTRSRRFRHGVRMAP